ncbi:MAG: recombinase family protein [Clostridia bacterium]|nr:recombinase family protein [Clostridia bacterium]
MNAVIYARYSCDNQREESIDGQIRECKVYAEKNGITVIDVYADRALTGKNDKRPAFQNMLKDAANGAFDAIIVWKLDRFARNREDSAIYKKLLKKNGISVYSATEPISDGPEGKLLEAVLEGIAEYYSAELGVKVDRGMTENVLNGKCNGGTPTLGYIINNDKRFELDPVVAPAIREAFEQYVNGASMLEIVNEMNSKGIRNSRGNKININIVTRMLHNRRYLGEYRYKDTVVTTAIPRIVSDELFEKVQEKLKVNQKASAKHKAEEEYLLSTKLFCGKCGKAMNGESGTSATKDRIYRYYKCMGVKKHLGCDKKTEKKELIEDIVVGYARQMLDNEALLNEIADSIMEALNADNTLLPVLYKERRDIEKKIDNMLDAIQQGIITASTKQRLEELEQQKKELVIQIAKEEKARPKLTKEQILIWFEYMKSFDLKKLSHRRRLIDTFINVIYLYDDKLVITFNYKDGAKTVDLNKINEKFLSSDKGIEGAPIKKTIHRMVFFIYFHKILLKAMTS